MWQINRAPVALRWPGLHFLDKHHPPLCNILKSCFNIIDCPGTCNSNFFHLIYSKLSENTGCFLTGLRQNHKFEPPGKKMFSEKLE